MWYFAWILGLGLAMTFGILNAIWFEIRDIERDDSVDGGSDGAGKHYATTSADVPRWRA